MGGGPSVGPNLTRAKLEIHQPGKGDSTTWGGEIATVHFDFNPTQVSLSRRANWTYTPAAAVRDAAMPEFMGSEPREMSLEIFLDRSTKPTSNDVLKNVEQLLECCEATSQSINDDQPSSPWVKFSWGSFDTAHFTAYVTEVQATYTLFNPTGIPIRATVQLSLHEIPQTIGGQNPTSGALTAQRVHRVVAGDSLQSLAWTEYGDATVWRAIAEANDIDDPSQLTPGRELMLPATEEVGL